jgi:SAM-dependent methyltransferase
MTTIPGAIRIAGGDTAAPRNLRKRIRLLAEVFGPPPRRVLDAGCGAGEYVVALSEAGYEATGVEYLPEKVADWAAEHPADGRVLRGDLAALPFPAGHFDGAVLNEVLEHVPDERAALAELRRVLRPGASLVVLSPNRLYPFETHGLDTPTGRRIPPVRTFLLPYLPVAAWSRWLTPWARNYWPWELRRLLRAAGFAVERTGYVWQTFENISGRQGRALRAASPVLRAIAATAERMPGVRAFGVSQVVVARR